MGKKATDTLQRRRQEQQTGPIQAGNEAANSGGRHDFGSVACTWIAPQSLPGTGQNTVAGPLHRHRRQPQAADGDLTNTPCLLH